jgi:hypothetical protein
MSILADIRNAVEDYPHEHLKVEIYGVDLEGNTLDRDEKTEFRIRVSNNGLLHVDEPQFLVEGLNGTLVKSNGGAAEWGSSFTTGAGWFPRVPAHSDGSGTVDMPSTEGFYFKPTRTSATVTDLVRVSVAGWASSGFDHLFAAHTDADPQAVDTYSSTVSED